jgi:hypothetical protein
MTTKIRPSARRRSQLLLVCDQVVNAVDGRLLVWSPDREEPRMRTQPGEALVGLVAGVLLVAVRCLVEDGQGDQEALERGNRRVCLCVHARALTARSDTLAQLSHTVPGALEVRALVGQPLGVIFGQGEDALAGLLAPSLLALETLQALLGLGQGEGVLVTPSPPTA